MSRTADNYKINSQLLEKAIEHFHYFRSREQKRGPVPTQIVRKEIQLFYRSIYRHSRTPTIRMNWERLSKEAKIFINIQLNIVFNKPIVFENLNLRCVEHRSKLLEASKKAKQWLEEKRGFHHDFATYELVRSLALIYSLSTGKKAGISSSQTTLGPSYKTPFEKILLANLAEAGIHLSIEGARALYRSAVRSKPKK